MAHVLAATPEFSVLHGPGEPDDPVSADAAARMAAQALPEGDPAVAGLAAAMAGLSRADAVAAIADAAPVSMRAPLLPGLFPGVAPDDPTAYGLWVALHDTPPAGLRLPPLQGPRISLAMLAGDSEAEAALRSLASLQAGAYPDWELCLATRLHSAWPARILARAAEVEPRLRLLPGPGGLDGLNAALATRTGAVAGCLQPGDTLPPTALWEAVQAWTAHPAPALLYSDEDQAGPDGVRRAPRFKPDYSLDAHGAGIPMGQLALYAAALLDQLGGLRPGPEPWHDLALRAAALAGPLGVLHVPAVLIHAAGPPPPVQPRPDLPAVTALPAVTVIVLTKDRPDLLSASSAGVLRHTEYPALELLVVDNGSTDPGALALLDTLAATPRVRVLRRPGPFNFSALNNAAVQEASGDILVLLNNDIEMPDPAWLRELVRHAVRPDVGAVGARLLHRDGTLQHGGMVLGPKGRAVHVLRGAPRDAPGYEGQLAVPRDMSAVTGACLAIRREVWTRVGGMDEDLPVAWNDVDLCQRVRAAGLRVVWTPDSVLLHLEGATRGEDAADAGRQAHFLADAARYRSLWGTAADEDPFLNPNLQATDDALVLAPPRRPRPWMRPPVTSGMRLLDASGMGPAVGSGMRPAAASGMRQAVASGMPAPVASGPES
ncbi:MAG: glycosyltransferase [Janthinobacterium lividum]